MISSLFSYKQCMCIPWDMPRPDGWNARICNSNGNACFYAKMKNYTYMSESCSCYPNCNTVRYSFTEKQSPIDTKRECDKSSKGFIYTTNRKLKYSVPYMTKVYQYLVQHNQLNQGSLKVDKELNYVTVLRKWCEESFQKDIAIIEVQIEGQSFTTIRQSLRTPFAAKIGGIGGTLGLFSGFSIMALVEIVYWMVLALKDSLKKSCCGPFKKNHSFTSTHA